MRKISSLLFLSSLTFASCGHEKTEDHFPSEAEEAVSSTNGNYRVIFSALNESFLSHASHEGTADVQSLDGELRVRLTMRKLPAALDHIHYISSRGKCPTKDEDVNGDGWFGIEEMGAPQVRLDSSRGKGSSYQFTGTYLPENLPGELAGKTLVVLGVHRFISLPDGMEADSVPVSCGRIVKVEEK